MGTGPYRSVPARFRWVQVGAGGFQLGAGGFLLGAGGCRWVQLGAGRCRWVQLGAGRCSWVTLLVTTSERQLIILVSIGCIFNELSHMRNALYWARIGVGTDTVT